MPKTPLRAPARVHNHLVDLMVEAYVEWREACALVGDADRAWGSATTAGARHAYELYRAALDEEERAAALYAGVVHRVEELVR